MLAPENCLLPLEYKKRLEDQRIISQVNWTVTFQVRIFFYAAASKAEYSFMLSVCCFIVDDSTPGLVCTPMPAVCAIK